MHGRHRRLWLSLFPSNHCFLIQSPISSVGDFRSSWIHPFHWIHPSIPQRLHHGHPSKAAPRFSAVAISRPLLVARVCSSLAFAPRAAKAQRLRRPSRESTRARPFSTNGPNPSARRSSTPPGPHPAVTVPAAQGRAAERRCEHRPGPSVASPRTSSPHAAREAAAPPASKRPLAGPSPGRAPASPRAGGPPPSPPHRPWRK